MIRRAIVSFGAAFSCYDGTDRQNLLSAKQPTMGDFAMVDKINGLWVVYSPVNQCWFLMWHNELLSLHETKRAALDEMQRLVAGVPA